MINICFNNVIHKIKFHCSFSIIAAAPIPVPMHILTIPNFPLVRFNSGNIVAISLLPVHPNGCPNAIAPPFGLTFFGSKFNFYTQNEA